MLRKSLAFTPNHPPAVQTPVTRPRLPASSLSQSSFPAAAAATAAAAAVWLLSVVKFCSEVCRLTIFFVFDVKFKGDSRRPRSHVSAASSFAWFVNVTGIASTRLSLSNGPITADNNVTTIALTKFNICIAFYFKTDTKWWSANIIINVMTTGLWQTLRELFTCSDTTSQFRHSSLKLSVSSSTVQISIKHDAQH